MAKNNLSFVVKKNLPISMGIMTPIPITAKKFFVKRFTQLSFIIYRCIDNSKFLFPMSERTSFLKKTSII